MCRHSENFEPRPYKLERDAIKYGVGDRELAPAAGVGAGGSGAWRLSKQTTPTTAVGRRGASASGKGRAGRTGAVSPAHEPAPDGDDDVSSHALLQRTAVGKAWMRWCRHVEYSGDAAAERRHGALDGYGYVATARAFVRAALLVWLLLVYGSVAMGAILLVLFHSHSHFAWCVMRWLGRVRLCSPLLQAAGCNGPCIAVYLQGEHTSSKQPLYRLVTGLHAVRVSTSDAPHPLPPTPSAALPSSWALLGWGHGWVVGVGRDGTSGCGSGTSKSVMI